MPFDAAPFELPTAEECVALMGAPIAFNAKRDELAREIAAVANCSDDAAGVAAGSFLAFRRGAAHNYGLNDAPSGRYMVFAEASRALGRFLAERGAA